MYTSRIFISSALLLCLIFSGCSSNKPTTEVTNTTDSVGDETTKNLASFCTETATKNVNIPAGDVLSLAQEADPDEFTFASQKGAEIIPVDENRSYAVWWQAPDFDINSGMVVVSLHGHGDYAIKDFHVWFPELNKYNVAYLGLQWWFGRSLENEGYYEPDQIYRLIAEELKAKGVPAGHVIFQGFSMGSARSYGISLYDKSCGNNYFGVNIANAGPWENNYPLYSKILTGQFGETPLEGTEWILFCGEQDENEYATTKVTHVCTGMENTKTTLQKLGANVGLFIKDPEGDHGSFMINQENVEEAMDYALNLLK
jgi:hypothetical protein